ncbi:MAG: hypothetical protein HC880_01360 [Bacteroidia bacterium]|nr:hypothetical protein [Bacteroidia bacterium]
METHRVQNSAFWRAGAKRGWHSSVFKRRELYLRGHGGPFLGYQEANPDYLRTWFSALKQQGVNFLRLPPDPPHQILYELADELGMMLQVEPAFQFKMPQDMNLTLGHMEMLIRQHQNHPSIIFWGASHETSRRGGGENQYLIDRIRQWDPSRPVFTPDYSPYSQYGDLLSHYFNQRSLFDSWQLYGPEKALLWTKMGVNDNRSFLSFNGTAGYEIASQEFNLHTWYATWEQLRMPLQRNVPGQRISGDFYRPHAWVPWKLSHYFFRWQPTNRNRPLAIARQNLETPGAKPDQVLPVSAPVNPWDTTLPQMEAQPSYYLFDKYLHPIRFEKQRPLRNVYGGDTIVLSAKLYYDDLRWADEISCRVARENGEVLTEHRIPVSLSPGQVIDSIAFPFYLPALSAPEALYLVRQFSYQDEAGYRDSLRIWAFPRADFRQIKSLAGKRIAFYSVNDRLARLLTNMGLPFETITKVKN